MLDTMDCSVHEVRLPIKIVQIILRNVCRSGTSLMDVQDPLLSDIEASLHLTSLHLTSYPSREEVVDEFNSYVRTSLRDRVLSLMGREAKGVKPSTSPS